MSRVRTAKETLMLRVDLIKCFEDGNLSQQKIAERCGCTQAYVSMFYNKYKQKPDYYHKLVKLFEFMKGENHYEDL